MAELAASAAGATFCAYYAAAEEVAEATRAAKGLLGEGMALGIGLEACPKLTPSAENLRAKVRAAWEAGAEELYFYNYGLMPRRSLAWLGEALGS